MTDLIDPERRRLLGAGAVAVAGATLGFCSPILAPARESPRASGVEDELASLRAATAWLNSAPLTAGDLQGKVVLVDVGTYTCINWLRTLPYIRAWAGRYASHGLAVIGVHAPEFPFEHDLDNVRRAMMDMRVRHPVAVDNSFTIWSAFRNHYWPSRYLIDGRGEIRHRQFGEGEYESSERAIQDALADAGAGDVSRELVSVAGQGIEAAPDWHDLKSPETYIGYERMENFALSDRLEPNERRIYAAPARLRLNRWALSGDWTVKRHSALLNRADGQVVMSFHARDLHLVMGPATRGVPVRFRVLLDGETPGVARGADVDAEGHGTITGPRLYQLIRQPKPIGDRQFAIEFLDAGAEAFAFTFG
ncbi:MAG TPA: hypothetical protein VEB19_16915 [Gemmatimonadaceae bacterium]|nr:hypothetical protein [Gemmatimonadaceae bacterium]